MIACFQATFPFCLYIFEVVKFWPGIEHDILRLSYHTVLSQSQNRFIQIGLNFEIFNGFYFYRNQCNIQIIYVNAVQS